MNTTQRPVLEARPAGQVWVVPLGILGLTALLAVAWVILNLVGGVEGMELVGPVFLLGGILRLVGDAAERSGAAIRPDARDAISRGSIGP